jgi:trigger factor
MHVTKEQKTPTKSHLVITATSEDLLPIKQHVLGHFKKSVRVQGFRPGKAPLSLIEKNVDQKAFTDEFMEHALNDIYRKALEQEKIRPVAQPNVELKKFVPYSDLEFHADVETIGEIKLANYKAMKLAKKPVTITAKDVSEVIANLQKRMAERSEVKRVAKLGDEVVIDFTGSDQDGNPVNGADGKDYPLILGSKSFIPGFEEEIVGLTAGEEKEFNITFPGNYGVSDLQNRKITFKLTAKKVQELKEPKLDDEFAKKAGPFKNLSELKADIKTQLKAEREREAQNQYENELVQKIVEKSSVEIPDVLIAEQAERLEEEEKRNLVYRGQTWQEHLQAEGVTEEEHRARHKPDAELRVIAGLVLSEIASNEQLSVEPEELKIHIEMLKGQYKDEAMQKELNKPENQNDIAAQLLTEKTLARLVEYSSKKE